MMAVTAKDEKARQAAEEAEGEAPAENATEGAKEPAESEAESAEGAGENKAESAESPAENAAESAESSAENAVEGEAEGAEGAENAAEKPERAKFTVEKTSAAFTVTRADDGEDDK